MDADPYALQDIFRADIRYEVPEFQRRYVWTEEDQWEPLWDDVKAVADDFLKAERSQQSPTATASGNSQDLSHFLGAVVVQKDADRLSDIRSRKVIDGQQRMITLQILLAAVRELFQEHHSDLARRIDKLVRNDDTLTGADASMQHKVWPTHPDRQAYQAAVSDSGETETTGDGRLIAARAYFSKVVATWLSDASSANGDKGTALTRALTRGVKLVVVEIEADEDEHVIYETLNARGTPLNAWDLVKNVIVNRASEEKLDPEDLLDAHLRGFDEEWWDQEVGSGKNRRSRADSFLIYWLIMRTGKDVPSRKASRLMSVFANHADAERKGSGVGIASMAEELGRDGRFFKQLELRDLSELDPDFQRGWRGANAGVFTPVLLWLHSQRVEDEEMTRCWQLLESYIVRRMACGLTTRGYFDLMLSLLERLHDALGQDAYDAIRDCLSERDIERYKWPTDAEFATSLTHEAHFGKLAAYQAKMILYRIEGHLRTGFSEAIPSDAGLTVEHLMPEDWTSHWPTPRGKGREGESAADMRNRYVQSMGNLTLLTSQLNSSVSNGAWRRKVAAIKQHSTLLLNREVVHNHPRKWTEEDIQKRGSDLAQKAIRCWPRVDGGA